MPQGGFKRYVTLSYKERCLSTTAPFTGSCGTAIIYTERQTNPQSQLTDCFSPSYLLEDSVAGSLTAHSASVPRIWARGEEWSKPRALPDTARTTGGCAQQGTVASTPDYPAGYVQLIQLQNASLPWYPSQKCHCKHEVQNKYMVTWKTNQTNKKLTTTNQCTVFWRSSRISTFLSTASEVFFSLCLAFAFQRGICPLDVVTRSAKSFSHQTHWQRQGTREDRR